MVVEMAQETVVAKKKRGPAPTGKGIPIMVRYQPSLLAAVKKWIDEEAAAGNVMTHPEAVRRLTKEALAHMGLLDEAPKD